MKRDTSKAALQRIAAELPARRAKAYQIVRTYPRRTAVELERITGDFHLHKRLSELEQLGLIVSLKTEASGVLWREREPGDPDVPHAEPTRAAMVKAVKLLLPLAEAYAEAVQADLLADVPGTYGSEEIEEALKAGREVI